MASPDERQARKEQRKERKAERSERRGERKRQHAEEEDGRARLLAKLLHCRDEDLAAFKEKRLPETSAATPVDLHRARRVLEGVAAILASTDPEVLSRLELAEGALLAPGADEADQRAEPLPGEPLQDREGDDIERPALAAPPPTIASPISRAAKPAPKKTGSPWSGHADAPPMPAPLAGPAVASPAVAPPVVAPPAAAVAPPAVAPPAAAVAPSPPAAAPRVEASPWARREEAPAAPRMVIDDEPTRAVDYELVAREALPFGGEAEPPAASRVADVAHPEAGSTSLAFAALKDEDLSPGPHDAPARVAGHFEGASDTSPQEIDDDATIGDPLGATAAGGSKPSPIADLPFKPHALPELSLEQYASLCAEREHRPGEIATIRRNWGVDGDDAERALDRRWQDRLRTDPAEAQRFFSLVASYKTWLASQR